MSPDPADPAAFVPTFVVVGNVNQGKSSIVASLAEDQDVPIAAMPGTTTEPGEYAFRSGLAVVFRIVDTPGFQQARAALHWLQQRARSAADRRRAVADFLAAPGHDRAFPDEVRLLTPILQGASILYVVDASARFQPTSEAEMEILRWTGQPGMALINRTRDRDHAGEWRPILEQFFNVVREYNAHRAGFRDRIELLRGFGAVRDDWRQPMERAVAAMQQQWTTRNRRAAVVIAELLARSLGHVERRRVTDREDTAVREAALQQAFHDALRQHEKQARAEIEQLYGHHRLVRREPELALLDQDLFSAETWRVFGLSKAQLARYAAITGAGTGGAVDLATAGHSLGLFMAAGAVLGAAAALWGGTGLARTWDERSPLAQALFPGDTGRFAAIGPVTSERFAWLLLDRALVHLRAVRGRSHARQDDLDLTADPAATAGVVERWPGDRKRPLATALGELRKAAGKGRATTEATAALADALTTALQDL